ncbi:MAG: DUF3179 domain-containing protein [Chloroflexi bacterium]|nr:DUF3179 domain-containing protein [Chloroflexota bacterium]
MVQLTLSLLFISVMFFAALVPALVVWLPALGVWPSYYMRPLRQIATVLSLPAGLLMFILWPNMLGLVTLILIAFGALLPVALRPWNVIRALDKTEHHQAADLPANSEVLAASINDQAIAWPVRLVIARHIINDTLVLSGGDSLPLLAIWCAACDAGLVYQREIDGQTLSFEVMGMYRRNMIIRDRETGSIWQQATGECLMGHYIGRQLEPVGGERLPWAAWQQRHPDTLLALEAADARRSLVSNDLMVKMFSGTQHFATPGTYRGPEKLPLHESVIGLATQGAARAYPLRLLEEHRDIEDSVGTTLVHLTYDPDSQAIHVVDRKTGQPLRWERHWWLGWSEFYPHTTVYRA